MSLKIATIEDLDLVVSMAVKFIEATEYKNLYTEDKIRELASNLLQADKDKTIIFLYGDVGFLAGVTSPFLFGDVKQASEVAWWVEPSARGKEAGKELIKVFEYWAHKVGCKVVTMVSLDEKVGKIYEKNGYKLYERAYLKEL